MQVVADGVLDESAGPGRVPSRDDRASRPQGEQSRRHPNDGHVAASGTASNAVCFVARAAARSTTASLVRRGLPPPTRSQRVGQGRAVPATTARCHEAPEEGARPGMPRRPSSADPPDAGTATAAAGRGRRAAHSARRRRRRGTELRASPPQADTETGDPPLLATSARRCSGNAAWLWRRLASGASRRWMASDSTRSRRSPCRLRGRWTRQRAMRAPPATQRAALRQEPPRGEARGPTLRLGRGCADPPHRPGQRGRPPRQRRPGCFVPGSAIPPGQYDDRHRQRSHASRGHDNGGRRGRPKLLGRATRDKGPRRDKQNVRVNAEAEPRLAHDINPSAGAGGRFSDRERRSRFRR